MNVRSLICEIICLLDFLMDVSSSKHDAAMRLRNVKWIANWIPFFFFFFCTTSYFANYGQIMVIRGRYLLSIFSVEQLKRPSVAVLGYL